MRTSQFFISTLKEAPSEAELVSHKLMLRAGLIRNVGSGLYTWMPLGLRVLRKVESIVRDEMDRAGAVELLMPAIQPAELWQESGRWELFGPQMLKIRDRHERDFCFGPTHEEVITDIARKEIRSYRQLPLNFYQIQTKFRDEIRPRFGVMRAREFVMKDAYSFHAGAQDLEREYRNMYDTYARIFIASRAEVPRGGRRHRRDRWHRLARISRTCRLRRGCDRLLCPTRITPPMSNSPKRVRRRNSAARPRRKCRRFPRPARPPARKSPRCWDCRCRSRSRRSRSCMKSRFSCCWCVATIS